MVSYGKNQENLLTLGKLTYVFHEMAIWWPTIKWT